MSNNASGRDGWRVPASEASLATVSPIFDAMKQLTISPKVSYPCVTALPFPVPVPHTFLPLLRISHLCFFFLLHQCQYIACLTSSPLHDSSPWQSATQLFSVISKHHKQPSN